MGPVLEELKELEYGRIFNHRIYKFFLLFGVFDKPARAMILNIKQSNGHFGCLKCYKEGQSVKYGNGSHIIYNVNIHTFLG